MGPKRKNLLKEFKSLKNITAASVEELRKAGLPETVAKNVYRHLHQETTSEIENNENEPDKLGAFPNLSGFYSIFHEKLNSQENMITISFVIY